MHPHVMPDVRQERGIALALPEARIAWALNHPHLSDWLRLTSSFGRDRNLVLLNGRCLVSFFDCIALVQATMPDVWVFRHEKRAGLIEDLALAGREGMVRLIAHWSVRLTAVEQRIGQTDLILIATVSTGSTRPLLRDLRSQGAPVFWPVSSLN